MGLFLFVEVAPTGYGQCGHFEFWQKDMVNKRNILKFICGVLIGGLILFSAGTYGKKYPDEAKSLVKIYTENGYGTGVIIEKTQDEVLIASNLHVIDGWNENAYVELYDGSRVFGQQFGADMVYDVGFIYIPISEFVENGAVIKTETDEESSADSSGEDGEESSADSSAKSGEDSGIEKGAERSAEKMAQNYPTVKICLTYENSNEYEDSSDTGVLSDADENDMNTKEDDNLQKITEQAWIYDIFNGKYPAKYLGEMEKSLTYVYDLEKSMYIGSFKAGSLTEGMSGSPVFTQDGCIGILTAGNDEGIAAVTPMSDILKCLGQ